MDLFAILAILLLILGVAGSLTPMVPGALLSISGLLVYSWNTGFTEPNLFVFIVLILTGLTALIFDWLAGSVAAKAGGASNRTTVAAGIVGLLAFFLAVPVGTVVGVAVTVYIREFLRTGENNQSLKAGIYSAIGVLGSSIVQFVLTALMLIVFLATLIF